MAKLKVRLASKAEVYDAAGNKVTLHLDVQALTTDAGAAIGNASGNILVTGLTAAQTSALVVGTEYNCPVQT